MNLETPVIEFHAQSVPIFSRRKKHFTTNEMINTLLDPDLDPNVIATTQPVGVESNALFIVDLKCLKHTKDIMCDDLGAWKNNGCHNTWVTVDSDGLTETRGEIQAM